MILAKKDSYDLKHKGESPTDERFCSRLDESGSMKIVCDNCSAKYFITDEKVAGKVFKIRCKRCSSVIVVRGDTGASEIEEESTRVHDYASEAVWHAVVDGEQQGPMTPIQLVALFARGSLTLESYAWREGFDDWKTLVNIPELAEMITPSTDDAPAAMQSSASTEASSGFEDHAESMAAAAEVGSESGLETNSLFGKPSSEEGADKDLFAGMPSVATPSEPAAAAPMTGQRNENSVLFSLDNLQALATGGTSGNALEQKKVSSVPPPTGDEGSGLIDIRALAQSTRKETSATPAAASASISTGDLFSAAPTANSTLAAPILAPVAEDPDKKNKWIWAAGTVMLAAIAVLGTLAFNKNQNEQRVAIADPGKTTTVTPVADAPKEAPVVAKAEEPKAEATPESEPKKIAVTPTLDSTGKKRAATRTTTKRPSNRTSKPAPTSDNIDNLMNQVLGGERKTAKTETKSTSSGSGLPSSPSRFEVGTALGGVSRAVKACKKDTPGTATVAVTFSGSTGKVKSASVISGPFKGTPIASCISSAVKRARVSRFSQSTFKVNYPYRL